MVPANSVGIKYNPFNGGTQEKTVGEGFYVKSPLEKIYKLSTKVQEFQFQNISYHAVIISQPQCHTAEQVQKGQKVQWSDKKNK